MQSEFKISMTEELNYFFRLEIKQADGEIFIGQSKQCKELLKRLGMEKFKSMGTNCALMIS